MTEGAHVRVNRRLWNEDADDYQRRNAPQIRDQAFTGHSPGAPGIPESELGVLGDVAGKDMLEFGCGGAQWSTALARTGLPVGFDLRAPAGACPAPAGGAGSPSRWCRRTPSGPRSATPASTSCSPTAGVPVRRPYRAVPRRPDPASRRPARLHPPQPHLRHRLPAGRRARQRAAGQRLLRAVPAAGRRWDGRVQPAVRDLDPAVPRLRPGGRGPDRAPARRRRHQHLPGRRGPGLVAALAGRVHLAAAQALSPAPLPPAR